VLFDATAALESVTTAAIVSAATDIVTLLCFMILDRFLSQNYSFLKKDLQSLYIFLYLCTAKRLTNKSLDP
jgi:hypothetical protein